MLLMAREIKRTWKGFIYLCNSDPRDDSPPKVADYITKNSHTITLDTPLF